MRDAAEAQAQVGGASTSYGPSPNHAGARSGSGSTAGLISATNCSVPPQPASRGLGSRRTIPRRIFDRLAIGRADAGEGTDDSSATPAVIVTMPDMGDQ